MIKVAVCHAGTRAQSHGDEEHHGKGQANLEDQLSPNPPIHVRGGINLVLYYCMV